MKTVPTFISERSGTITLSTREADRSHLHENHYHNGVTDFYLANADIFDAVSAPAWEVLGPALRAALAHGNPSGHPVADVGAGTGLATAVVAEAWPDVEILAIEPSAALRPALMTRLTLLPGLQERVTMLPTDLAGAVDELPEKLGGLVAANVLGHLPPKERQLLWGILAERLVEGAVGVIGLQPPARPESIPETLFGTVRVGRRSYEGWGAAEPAGEDTVTWHMTWRIREGDRLVDERSADATWWTVSEDAVVTELRDAGLEPTVGEAGFIVATKGSG